MYQDFGNVLIFIFGGAGFVSISLLVAKLIRPDRPNPEKLTTYESGEDPVGSAWGQFNLRFYIVALMFVLFEAEMVFLFPWVVIYTDPVLMEQSDGLWGRFLFYEMLVFIGILFLGLVYAWRKGFLDWVKPPIDTKDYRSPVPSNLYEQVNERYS